MTIGEMLVRHRLTQVILYLGVVWSENMKAIPSELQIGISSVVSILLSAWLQLLQLHSSEPPSLASPLS